MPLHSHVKLQPHQEEAVAKARGKEGGILVNHGLGSGKTLTSMAIAEERGGNVLAVVPAALRNNYHEQLKKFVPEDRHKNYKIISYHEFMRDPHKYVDTHKPNTLVADEVHRLRNPKKMKGSFADVRSKVPFMVGMTGSLVNNHPQEAIELTNLVNGKPVMTKEHFERHHIGIKQHSPGLLGRLKGAQTGETEHIRNKETLRKTLDPHIHRFTGDENYKKNLPKVEYEDIDVPMSQRQRDMIKALSGANPALAHKLKNNLPPSKEEAKQLNTFMMGMRQVSNNPGTLDKNIKNHMEESPKLQRAAEEIEKHQKNDPNFRGVTYSRFLDGGVRPIAERTQGHVYEGSLSDKKREGVLKDFHEGKKKHIGISPSGGEGLDLKGVKLMQVLEPDWNPETTSQAIGRAIRYKSHAHLPEHERTVKVQRFRSVYPDGLKQKIPLLNKLKAFKKETSPDEYLASRAKEKDDLNKDFLSALENKK